MQAIADQTFRPAVPILRLPAAMVGGLLALIFLGDMLAACTGIAGLPYGIYLAATAIAVPTCAFRLARHEISRSLALLLLADAAFFILAALFQHPWSQPTYFMGPFLAVFFASSLDQKTLRLVLVLVLAGSICAQLVEVVRGQYLFVRSVAFEGEILELDAKLFSGIKEVFRSKGFFDGPLTSAGVTVLIAFAFRKRPLVVALALGSALLSQARLASIILFILLLNGFVSWRFTIQRRFRPLLYLCLALGLPLTGLFAYRMLMASDFFSAAFSLADPGNVGRLETYTYILDSMVLHAFSSVSDLVRFLFGDSGYIHNVLRNSAESFPLQVFADLGLLGLAGTAYFMGRLAWRQPAGKRLTVLEAVLLIGFLAVTPTGEKLYLNLLCWLIMLPRPGPVQG